MLLVLILPFNWTLTNLSKNVSVQEQAAILADVIDQEREFVRAVRGFRSEVNAILDRLENALLARKDNYVTERKDLVKGCLPF